MVFWVVIAGLTTVVAAILGRSLVRVRAGEGPAAGYDLQVYRDQLKEVDRDLARGVITDGEAERVRTEVSRRILTADTEAHAQTSGEHATKGSGMLVAGVLMAIVGGGAVVLYAEVGAPGYPDLPLKARIAASDAIRADRLSQAEAEALIPPRQQREAAPEFQDLMERLRQTVKDRPDDLQGLALLARNEAALGNVTPAYQAQTKVIEIKGDTATASDYALVADLMIAAAGGYVSVESEEALKAALARSPTNYAARYYMGEYMLQVDRPDSAFGLWEALLRDSPPDAPWLQPIRDQIEDIASRAGIRYSLPPLSNLRGPNTGDISASAELSEAERAEMIQNMVKGLSDRLATEGGTPEEWGQLIRAHVALGNGDRALLIYTEAKKVFSEQPGAMDTLRAQARELGMPE